MAQWTSAVGAAQLARLITSQQGRSATSGTRKPPAYRSLADGIRLLVLEGRVPVAARLPAERELAVALTVSRTTVAAAYEALRGEGFLESRRGAGSWTAVPAGNPLPARGLEPLPPESLGSMIDLGCAALPPPSPGSPRPSREPWRNCRRTRTPTATTPPACPPCAGCSPTATPSAASPRCPSRSW